ncbi:hypothetical protein WCX18_11980 [Sulfurimonas sp. HSL1-2]|uniref:hypothetical protein n=1 Tax=Thiomicrolovo zhangzhouensis TaxID=3131933 RepID=UPI0031F8611F
MMKMTGRVWTAGLLALLTLTGADADEYRLGEGVQVGKTPLYLGGYFSLNYWNNFKGTSEVVLDDLAVMLYGTKGAWSGLAEVEWGDLYRKRYGYGAQTDIDGTPHAERVFAQYEPSERLQVTVGKFNTPVGYWNRMPVNVLRDTTSSPNITEEIFPRFTTGIDAKITTGIVSVNVLIQMTPDLDAAFNGENLYNNFDIERQSGIGMTLEQGVWSCGVNAGRYEERVEEESWNYLYASGQYRTAQTRIMAEAGYRQNDDNTRSNAGGYIQGSQQFFMKHYAVLRLEYTTDYIANSDDSIAVVGYTYRPLFPVALKGEYQFHTRENEDMMIVSFSMLF